jgi:hypothetical protein
MIDKSILKGVIKSHISITTIKSQNIIFALLSIIYINILHEF